MKRICLFMLSSMSLISVFSQNEWNSTTTSTAAMYRNGFVAIGTGVANTTLPFVVMNPSAGKPTKVLFGSKTYIGSTASTEGIIQVQSPTATFLELYTGTTTKYLAKVGVNSSNNMELNYGPTSGSTKTAFSIVGNGVEAFKIDGNGRVGIGTGTTNLGTCKLAVEGIIGCRELKVTLASAWPDFVFSSTHQRMNFTELGNFIESNKHLPNLPSAKEVEKEGNFNVGETQVKMLQSLEELYLYVLDIKKENEKLKQEISNLKNSK